MRAARLVFAEEGKRFNSYFCADSPEACCDYWKEHVATDPTIESGKEHLIVLLMNARLRVFAHHIVSMGSLNECTAHPREILRAPIVQGAFCFVMMHNHPSGDPSPSRNDRELTKRIAAASNLMQIDMLDHVIVGEKSPHHEHYFSFKESGIL